MSERTAPSRETAAAAREVEAEVEGLPDPEGGPQNPAGTLAVGAISGRARRAKTRAEILQLAWPVMLSMGLASVVGIVDVAMVKHLGADAQAAVGYGAQVFMLAQAVLFALSFACVALMARAIGAGQPREARRVLAASLAIALGAAGVLFVVLGAEPRLVLSLLRPEPAVMALAPTYLRLVMTSTLLLAICLTLESALRANRDTFTPMAITVVVSLAKIGLNALLIYGALGIPELGVAGAGWATLGAQCVGLLGFALVVLRSDPSSPMGVRARDFRGLGPLARQLVAIALPGVGERVILQGAMLTYFTAVGSYGTFAAAAYSIGVRLLSFSWIPGNGYSQAAATIVGQALGAGDVQQAERATRRAANLAVATAIVMGIAAALLGRTLAETFTADPHTIEALVPFMLCLALAQPFMQLHFTMSGAFRGAGDTWTPLVAAFIGNWGFRVPLAWLVTNVLDGPLVLVWAVLMLDHVARAAWLLWSFRRRDWARRVGGIAAA